MSTEDLIEEVLSGKGWDFALAHSDGSDGLGIYSPQDDGALLDLLIAEDDIRTDCAFDFAERIVSRWNAAPVLARALKESKAEAATLRERVAELEAAHWTATEAIRFRGMALIRVAHALGIALSVASSGEAQADAIVARAKEVKAERDRLTGAEMRDKIVWILADAHSKGRPGALVEIADAIMSLLKGEGR